MQRLETTDQRKAEAEIFAEAAPRFPGKILRREELCAWDFEVLDPKTGRLRSLIEIKDRPTHRFPSIWFPVRKLLPMCDEHLRRGGGMIYVVRLRGAIVFIDLLAAIERGCRVVIGGRTDRGHAHDRELVLDIPIARLGDLSPW